MNKRDLQQELRLAVKICSKLSSMPSSNMFFVVLFVIAVCLVVPGFYFWYVVEIYASIPPTLKSYEPRIPFFRRPFPEAVYYCRGHCQLPHSRMVGNYILSVVILDEKIVTWLHPPFSFLFRVDQKRNSFSRIIDIRDFDRVEIGHASKMTGLYWLHIIFQQDSQEQTMSFQLPNAQRFIDLVYEIKNSLKNDGQTRTGTAPTDRLVVSRKDIEF